MPDCVKLPECRVSADIVQPLASLLDANTLRQKDLWGFAVSAFGASRCQPLVFGRSAIYRTVAKSRSGSLGLRGVLQPIMPLDLPVKVRPWELTVYPRSHIRR